MSRLQISSLIALFSLPLIQTSAQEEKSSDVKELIRLTQKILAELQTLKTEVGQLRKELNAMKKPVVTAARARNEKIRLYATSLMKKYDKNGDNSLSLVEQSAIRSLPRNSDTDGNGELDIDELFRGFGGKDDPMPTKKNPMKTDGRSQPDTPKTGRSKESTVSGAQKGKIDKFSKSVFQTLDENSDGMLTPDECKRSKVFVAKGDGDGDGKIALAEFVKFYGGTPK